VAGTLSITLEAVDYAALLEDIVSEYRPKLAQKGQTLHLDLPPGLPPIVADPDHTRRSLAELLDNAWKFTPEGGHLSLTVAVSRGEVRTTVADDGPGIAPERLSSLLKPFDQADFSCTRQHGGMGLGLTIAYHLIPKMGGMMLIDSRPDEGTRVHFTLPRAEDRHGMCLTRVVDAERAPVRPACRQAGLLPPELDAPRA
jgi:signal transduction histidine kinase